MDSTKPLHITLIGAGTIGLSFAALHLSTSSSSRPIQITIYDTRPDITDYIYTNLPSYIPQHVKASQLLYAYHADSARLKSTMDRLFANNILRVATDLGDAVYDADIIQEQGPENLEFKAKIWKEVEDFAPPSALFWSSTSGIPASLQSKHMKDPGRLLVVHPYNPPHLMPLLEVVPSPATSPEVVQRTVEFWRGVGREPVVLKKECTGFVANRLAFALFREAIHLVNEGVASVEDVDTVVQASMGPRWTVAGPFKSYHAGGGQGGLEAFFKNIGGTVQQCWDDAGRVNVGDGWEGNVFKQTQEAYGVLDVGIRDKVTKRVLEAVSEAKATYSGTGSSSSPGSAQNFSPLPMEIERSSSSPAPQLPSLLDPNQVWHSGSRDLSRS
ncbi:hypothetical protein MMC16_003536 [Acarospora aff. strigata]|nr:hypothetical protein [Acarospora aff. strigata]